MGLLDRWKRADTDDAGNLPAKDRDRLRRAFDTVQDRVSIAECTPRTCVRIGGIVTQTQTGDGAQSRQFSATVSDDTGQVQLIWLGRAMVPGVVPGVLLLARGTVGTDRHGQMRIFDPQYSIQVNGV